MRSRFALTWLRCAAGLFAGSFTAIELALAAADTSLRALTTFDGFLLVLALHSVASVALGLLLAWLLAIIDERAAAQADAAAAGPGPEFGAWAFGRPGWAREKGTYLALRVLHGRLDVVALDTCASLMSREFWEYGPDHAREFSRGFLDEVALSAAQFDALRASVAARLPAAEMRELLRRFMRREPTR